MAAKTSRKPSKSAEGGKQASSPDNLKAALKARFEDNMHRHKGLTWASIEPKLNAGKLATLQQMEDTGGEPDVVALAGGAAFVDCSAESPEGRRSVCFDREGWESRKEARPKTNAVDMASDMGVEMLTEAEYRELQQLGEFDLKTSSWVQTPKKIRELGGALFCDRRYDTVFTYHNGAQSYYAARGFRAKLKL
jgi:hypothetical protein